MGQHFADQILLGIEMGVERPVGQARIRHDAGDPDRGDAVLAKLPRRHLDNALAGQVLVSLFVPHGLFLAWGAAERPCVPAVRPYCITIILRYYDHNLTSMQRSQEPANGQEK